MESPTEYRNRVLVELENLGYRHLVRHFIPLDSDSFNEWMDIMVMRGFTGNRDPKEIAQAINEAYWHLNSDNLRKN